MERPNTPLRQHRERAGFTQMRLAVVAGVSIQVISLAERGLPLSPAMAAKLAAALNVAPEALRGEARQ